MCHRKPATACPCRCSARSSEHAVLREGHRWCDASAHGCSERRLATILLFHDCRHLFDEFVWDDDHAVDVTHDEVSRVNRYVVDLCFHPVIHHFISTVDVGGH